MRFGFADMEFSVSGEEVGWRVVVEGEVDPAKADEVVAQITDQLSRASQQDATWSVVSE